MYKNKKKKSSKSQRGQRISAPSTFGGFNRGIDRSDQTFKTTFRLAPAAFISDTSAGTVTTTETSMVPSGFGARGVAFADLFQYYRIVGMRINGQAHMGANATYQMQGNCSWYLGVNLAPLSTYSAPTSVANFIDSPHIAWTQDFNPNSISLAMSRQQLLRQLPLKWLKTASTGVNDEELIQGTFTVISVPKLAVTIASILEIIVEYDVEFSGPIDPALIPQSQGGRRVVKIGTSSLLVGESKIRPPTRITVTPSSAMREGWEEVKEDPHSSSYLPSSGL
jgi:hypothetical protein